MTRWARARGSKGANEKLPEEGTNWTELKRGLTKDLDQERNEDVEESSEEGDVGDHNVKGAESVWASFDGPVEKDEGNELTEKDSDPEEPEEMNDCKQELSRTHNLQEPRESNNSMVKHPDDVGSQEGDKRNVAGKSERGPSKVLKKEDARRISLLKKSLFKQGIPRQQIMERMKMEKRKANISCFSCREKGHVSAECPKAVATGICFTCGSTEHYTKFCRVKGSQRFKFATCFICKEEGHIARECPDNDRGIYPNGGACRSCGDVTHLKRHCPVFQKKKAENNVTLKMAKGSFHIEALDDDQTEKGHSHLPKKPKIVKL